MATRALAALLVVGVLAGCTRTYPGGGTILCGRHLDTGAMSVQFEPLDPHAPAPPGRVPTVSSLPPPLTNVVVITNERYVRTSPTCAAGALVGVAPVDAASLAGIADAAAARDLDTGPLTVIVRPVL